MAITISGENNNDKILATDGVIDQISGFNIVGVMTATSFVGDLTGDVTGNLTGNVNNTSPLLLQTGGSERIRLTGNNEIGIAGANYGSAGQVLTSGGSGNAVTWSAIPAQITFSNQSNNRILTSEGGIGVNAEANLTYDGNVLALAGNDNQELKIGAGADLILKADGSNSAIVHNGDGDLVILAQGSNENIKIQSTGYLHFNTAGNNERLRIDSNGRVIIGKVMTAGSGSHYDDITINNSNQSGTAGSTGIDLISSNDAYGGLLFSDEDASEQGYIKYWHNSDSDKMRFGTNSNDRWEISKEGHWIPASDSSYDIGTNATRVRYLYTDYFYSTSLSYDGNKLKLGGGSRALSNGYYDDIVIDNSDTTSGEAGGVGISLIAGNQSWCGLIFGDNDVHQRGYIKYSHEFDYMQIVVASGQVRILSNGTVNIGGDYEQTTYNLSVTHASNFLRLKDSNEGNYDLRFMIQNSEANIWHYGTDDFVFGCRYDRKLSFITNGQKRFTIHGNNIGINDTTPSYTLNVVGDNAASNGIGMLKGIIGVQNDTTAYGSYPTAGISFQTKYRTGPDVPLDVAAIYGGKENTTNGDKDGYMGFAVREEPGSGTQERMRITSDGNLIIGHTSGSNKLQIGNTGHSGYCIAANSPTYGAVIQVGDGSTPTTAAALWVRNLNNGGGTTACFRVQGDGTVHFGDQTSTGKYSDGVKGASWYDAKDSWQQGQSGGLGWSMWYLNKIGGTSTDNRMIQFNNSGSAIGYIQRSGSNIVYQTSSDYRLKKDVVALPNSIERVKQLRPVAFKWIEDNSDMEGFLAHEAQEICPYAVSGTKDEVATEDFGDRKKGDMIVQAIDYGEFTPLLTAAMQELIAKVETLEAEVAALKGS